MRKNIAEPTAEAMCRLALAQERVADSLISRISVADVKHCHVITLSLDEAYALATDAYEARNVAQWAWNRLRRSEL